MNEKSNSLKLIDFPFIQGADGIKIFKSKKTEVLTDISEDWAEFELELTGADDSVFSVKNKSVGVSKHKIPSGTYSVKVLSSPYCTVKVDNSITISENSTLNVNVYPLSDFT